MLNVQWDSSWILITTWNGGICRAGQLTKQCGELYASDGILRSDSDMVFKSQKREDFERDIFQDLNCWSLILTLWFSVKILINEFLKISKETSNKREHIRVSKTTSIKNLSRSTQILHHFWKNFSWQCSCRPANKGYSVGI